MEKIYDVIISGAGPSGSLLGYLLSTKNISTLILEKEQFPRYKVCAGGIQWKTLQMFPYDIKEVIEKEIYGIYFSRKLKDIFYKKYSEPLIYTVNRIELDDFMAKKAISSGCAINFNEEVKNFEINGSKVKIYTKDNTYFSKILIGADGVSSIIFRKLNKSKKMQKIIGYETEIPAADLNFNSFFDNFDKNLMIDLGGVRKGYTWIFPKKNYLSVGDGGPVSDTLEIKKYLLWFLKNYQSALNKQNIFKNGLTSDKNIDNDNQSGISKKLYFMQGFEAKYEIKAHLIPVRTDNTFLCDNRILTVGDAAGLGDGFTGEGLYNAILSSNIAGESIIDALRYSNFEFHDYFEKVNNEIYKNIRNSLIISKIFFSSPLFYYKLIKNSDNLFNSCAKILRGEKTYNDVVNKLKLIKI
ncbi:NAD(P)/FAD-dependent oxidoreductase [bacterium]|nr:NAD(P)/FAD-dependent oxidoreductase [bacterium]